MKINKGLVWIRRDYRLKDHHALFEAQKNCNEVYVCFIFDQNIIDKLDPNDKRISFIIQSLRDVDNELRLRNSKLIIRYGEPKDKLNDIVNNFNIDALFYNRDYEPYAVKRDQSVEKSVPIKIFTFKDHVIYEKDEVKTKTDGFYKVFTPYKNQWLAHLSTNKIENYDTNLTNLGTVNEESSIHEDRWYKLLGFNEQKTILPGGRQHGLNQLLQFNKNINEYDKNRDYPGLNQTSNLSPYLRFGCLSIREVVQFSLKSSSNGANIWLSELIWRDFYQMISATHPNCDTESIKKEYDLIDWQGTENTFEKWCNGLTGYPIVDAAMRQLNTTGLMHNRCRMIVASFLCKTLLVNWRKGESYFAKKLLDFDFASNNGGWGWASSSGCDAQPYFRIFNPYLQSKKFDPHGTYIRKYCPELSQFDNKDIHDPPPNSNYPRPIVDYSEHRKKALDMYAIVKT